jgi:shikimate kinase
MTEPCPQPQDSSSETRRINATVHTIFLVGYRGTGKTTIAPLLAEKLGWHWVDADRALEHRYGKTIRLIFAEEGEAGFRDKEELLLGELCRKSPQVIATGGGVVLREANRRCLNEPGRAVVWLTADGTTISERLQGDPATAAQRPDLSIGGLTEIEEMLRVRSPLYQAVAHCTVDTVGRSPAEIVATILEHLPRR